MSIDLSQHEADLLFHTAKVREDEREWELSPSQIRMEIPLLSEDNTEKFILDIRRHRLNLLKGTLQNRARGCIILARLDYGGQPHRNPDEQEIPSPHLHVYKEGYGDKWAYPIDPSKFSNIEDHWKTLNEFLEYCNVTEPPRFKRGLFT
ncbi:hypothetical protein GFGA_1d0839 [Gluconobacter frateurii NBRC 103465]|nr:hypothetical protein GFGA_1d0839 [Gluconobacter frateurii NBRC 103465]